jgi:hypothetical protein
MSFVAGERWLDAPVLEVVRHAGRDAQEAANYFD